MEGDTGEYVVEIEVDKKTGNLYFDCDCPYAETDFRKHMIAAALEVNEYLRDEVEYDEEEF